MDRYSWKYAVYQVRMTEDVEDCSYILQGIDMIEYPLLIAHRGGMANAPENTDAAFARALTYPVDGMEFDVQLSSDGIPVIYHDRTLYKINGRRRRVSDYTLAELLEMDFGNWFSAEFSGERILTLEQVLKSYSGRTSLLVEIKSREIDRFKGRSKVLTSKVLALLEKYVARKEMGNTYILSFDLDVLKQVHRKDSAWQCMLNTDYPGLDRMGLPGWLHGCGAALKKLKPGFVEYLHGKGLKAMTYSCNIPMDTKKAQDIGTDIILTDNPEWLCGYMGRA